MSDAPKSDVKCYGVSNVTKNGQITVPSEARDEIGIVPNGRVIVFGDRASGQLIVLAAPPDDKLLDLAVLHAPKVAAVD